MKKIKTALIVAIIMLGTNCMAQKKDNHKLRYTPKQIQTTLDSICKEGFDLYVAEVVNWVSTDSALAHYDGNESYGGSYIWQPNENTWNAVFFDKNKDNCIFEYSLDLRTGEENFNYTPRPVTDTDTKQFTLKKKMMLNALEKYGDSLTYDSNCGNPNFDFIRIDNNTIRLYIIQGTIHPNIIPFGNDYSIDFDNEGNPKQFRKYHQSLIAIPTVNEDGEKIRTTCHSHLKDNPFITPTDICNFLLYHGDMEQTWVLSTALDCYIIYDAKTKSASFITRKAMNKIMKKMKD